jgi:hypothetical protein
MRRLLIIIIPFLFYSKPIGGGELPINQDFINAKRIVKYYRSVGIKVHTEVVEATIKAIDHYLPKYFPNGPFTKHDFIALAMAESDFHQYEVGASGEQGIFQIMKMHISEKVENPFGIRTNTRLAMLVLREKYRKHQDYKKAIIAYNGVVKMRRGGWSERYWRSFQKRREIVKGIFNS